MTKLLIADDDNLVRDAVAFFLQAKDSSITVMSAPTLDDALHVAREHPDLDLVLLDWRMPGMTGFDSLAQIRAVLCCERTKIVILSSALGPDQAQEAIRRGAAGVISKTLHGSALLHAIRLILSGEIFVSSNLQALPPDASGSEAGSSGGDLLTELSERERETLQALARGLTNKEIARELGIAEITVKVRLRAVFRKIGARNRAEAIRVAVSRRVGAIST